MTEDTAEMFVDMSNEIRKKISDSTKANIEREDSFTIIAFEHNFEAK